MTEQTNPTPPQPRKKKARVNPQHVRNTRQWDDEISDGSITLRRCDLMNLVLTGKMEAGLLTYAEMFENMVQRRALSAIPTAQLIQELEPDDREGVLRMFRIYACAAIVDPVYVVKDEGDPNTVPVDTIGTTDLIHIWNATPPAYVETDPDQPLQIPVSERAREAFRPVIDRGEQVPESSVPDRADPVPPNKNVQTKTIELPHGRMVELASQ